jgi:antitoxin component YwqK of YwqJK toxin-antitoxin module
LLQIFNQHTIRLHKIKFTIAMKHIGFFILTFFSFFGFAQTTDASGKKQGYWKKYDEKSKKLIYEGEFKDNKPVGKFKYYYPNDSLQAIMHFKEKGKIAYAMLFHTNGKRMGQGKYIGELKDSVWTFYDEAGILISMDRYSLGKKDGKSFVFDPDGLLVEERSFKNDLQDGEFMQFFPGKILKSKGNYVNGSLEGKVIYYYPNGTEAAAGYYVKGRKNAHWIYRDKDGKVTSKELYRMGELASKKETEEYFSRTRQKEPAENVTPSNGVKKADIKKTPK